METTKEASKNKKASKKSTRAEIPNALLQLTYHLSELPTSQHRAGLVGLVMMMRFVKECGVDESDAHTSELTATTVTFRFTQAGMQALFDQTYSTSKGDNIVDKPFKNKNKEDVPPERTFEEEVTDKKGNVVKKTKYVYPKFIPSGAYLARQDPTGDQGLWIKLWRDMLWAIPRGVPATRNPFEARGEGQTVTDGKDMYDDLTSNDKKSVALASTYFLGAQANTADSVSFSDMARNQLLLHFWPFAVEIFVPSVVDREGKTEFDGYAFAFPDVANLREYCDEYIEFLRHRSPDKAAYLPKAAIVDLPGESGLRTMSWLKKLLSTRTQRTRRDVTDLILAVDVVHARKDGNNVRILSHARVEPWVQMFDEYEALLRSGLLSSTFRRQRLINLLTHRRWFSDFDRLFSTLPSGITFDNSFFQNDARKTFKEMDMNEPMAPLAKLIHQVAKQYLNGKLYSKNPDLKYSPDMKQHEKVKYNTEKAKVAREALLAIRSRTGSDFQEYVAVNLFSVSQRMPEESYLLLAEHLIKDTEQFRALLLLALSAQMPRPEKSSTTENE